MKRAIIDIGTNSVRLLEAIKGEETGAWQVVRKEINSSRLGESMSDDNLLAEGARERTLQAIREFVVMAQLDGFRIYRVMVHQ